MAQPATAIHPDMLRRMEVRCANIKRMAFILDLKCWNLERMIERLGMETCDRDYDQSEMGYECIVKWVNEAESRIKAGLPTGH